MGAGHASEETPGEVDIDLKLAGRSGAGALAARQLT